MSSALMELETLSADQVARVMNMLDNMGLERILVTDPRADPVRQPHPGPGERGGCVLRPVSSGRRRRHRLRPAVLSVRPVSGGGPALQGNDVLYTHYEDGVFLSTAAAPILYRA